MKQWLLVLQSSFHLALFPRVAAVSRDLVPSSKRTAIIFLELEEFDLDICSLWRRSMSLVLDSVHQGKLEATIIKFCKLGRLKEALKVLYSNKIASLDLTIYSSILQLCINLNANGEGRSLHNHLMTNGYRPNMHLDTKLIIFYSKTGDVDAAREVFDEMHDKSIVSWSAMISGYTKNGFLQEALETFVLMRRSGVGSNQFAYGSILRACSGLGCLEGGRQVHASVVRSGFVVNLFVQSALMDLHLKCGYIVDAQYLFENMEYRDVVTWNAVIGGHAVRGLGEDAIGFFCSMLRDGMLPDHFTFGSVLRACCGNSSLVKVNQIHGIIVNLGFESNHIVTGSLIDAYAKCRSMSSARFLYDSMPEKDLISCTAVITGYSQLRCCSGDALELFLKIHQMGMKIDGVIICSVLNICANTALVSFGKQVHARAFKIQPYCDIAMNNALVDMYAKSGDIEDARQAFDDMKSKNVISWTSMISGYGKHGFVDDAIELFEMMEDDGFEPNDVTFLSLVSACSHAGLTDKGWECFNSMVRNYGINPRAEHYSCVVDLFARGGQLEDAYNFVCKNDLKLNASLWGALLGACRVHGNMILGEFAANILFSLEPENSVNYVVLANIYAAAGLWEDAWKTRKLMEARLMKKVPGYSIIQFFPKKRTPLFLEI